VYAACLQLAKKPTETSTAKAVCVQCPGNKYKKMRQDGCSAKACRRHIALPTPTFFAAPRRCEGDGYYNVASMAVSRSHCCSFSSTAAKE
jgi:hypothetical protein